MAAPTLWEAALADGGTAWLLEWALERAVRRRVLVAVDTSDSCVELRPEAKHCLRVLSEVLEPGDVCSVWTMGRTEKAAELTLTSPRDRVALAATAIEVLRPFQGGTWLAETLAAMVADERRYLSAGITTFLVALTDGEVFDAETLAVNRAGRRVLFMRLGRRDSPQLTALRRRVEEVTATHESLRRTLSAPPMAITFAPGWEGTRAKRFSLDGELLPGDPFQVDGRQDIRIAFIGAARPQPSVTYGLGGTRWTETAIDLRQLAADGPEHLRRVVRGLSGHTVAWDWDRLQQLATNGHADLVLSCPRCRSTARSVRTSLFCTACEALLVSKHPVSRRDLAAPHRRTLAFPLSGDGRPGAPSPYRGDARDDAYWTATEGGECWLVLDLYRH